MESVLIGVGILSVLTVVTLRQDFAGASDAGSAAVSIVGDALLVLQEWTFYIGPGVVVGVGNGLILGYLMYTSGLVPQPVPHHQGLQARPHRRDRAERVAQRADAPSAPAAHPLSLPGPSDLEERADRPCRRAARLRDAGCNTAEGAAVEKIMWLVLGGTAFVAALRAGRSRRAMLVGRVALGVLFIVFGAAVNAVYLALGNGYYDGFADASPFPFVRDTWHSLVLPNQVLLITLLIIFEAAMGVLILSGGRRTQAGLLGLIGFHIGQLAFGGVLWPWAVVMLVTLTLLLRAERHPPAAPAAPLPRDPTLTSGVST